MPINHLPNSNFPNLQEYLWLPLIVSVIGVIATAFFSYLVTNIFNKNKQKEEKRIKRIDLIDRLLLEINKLNIILEKLRDDLEGLHYFSIKNLNIGKPIGWKLKTLSDDAILLPDTLRRETIDVIDVSTSLIDEMDNLERVPVGEYTEHINRKNEIEKEYRTFNCNLLAMGIWFKFNEIRNVLEPKYTSVNRNLRNKNVFNDEQLKAADKINNDFNRALNESKTKLDAINANTVNSRGLLNTRLLGILTQLNNLTNNLDDVKTTLITKNRHFIFFNSYPDL